ncbi:TPA: CHAP domain-containing protein [Neisseria subflava]|jgi:hypothetical protein|nr:CHAP domain-containing protein [uncultured Neisseria sp.]
MDTNKTGNHKQENQRDQVREQVINDYIENLRKYNGYTEKGKDNTIFGAHYGMQGKYWCDMYVDYVMEDSFGRRNAQKMLGGFSAGTELSKDNYQKIGNWHDAKDYVPQKGDQIFFLNPTKDKSRTVNHTGVVIDVDLEKGIVYTIEGNTSAKPGDSNGTTVREKQYPLDKNTIKGYGTPDWNIEVDKRIQEIEINKSSTVNELSSKDKLQNLINGFKHDKDGTFTAKALADNADVVANFRDELRETLKQNQTQEVAQNTPQVQEECSYGGRSFG